MLFFAQSYRESRDFGIIKVPGSRDCNRLLKTFFEKKLKSRLIKGQLTETLKKVFNFLPFIIFIPNLNPIKTKNKRQSNIETLFNLFTTF